MSEHESVPARPRSTGVNRSLSRAWAAPVRAMNRFLGTADGSGGPNGRPRTDGSAVVDCGLYIDECQNVIARDEKISTILDECRSQKIGLILSHQRTAQISNDNVLSALRNCAMLMSPKHPRRGSRR